MDNRKENFIYPCKGSRPNTKTSGLIWLFVFWAAFVKNLDLLPESLSLKAKVPQTKATQPNCSPAAAAPEFPDGNLPKGCILWQVSFYSTLFGWGVSIQFNRGISFCDIICCRDLFNWGQHEQHWYGTLSLSLVKVMPIPVGLSK